MKKFKTLSILLSVLTAFSGMSVASVSAATTEQKEFAIIDYPENILENDVNDILYGITLQLPNGSTMVTSESTFDYVVIDDYSETFGYVDFFAGRSNSSLEYGFSGTMYVSEYCDIQVYYYDYKQDNFYSCDLRLDYSDDYELPEVFCKDRMIFEKNEDNTLTLKAAFTPYYDYDEDYNIIYQPLEIPETVNGMTVTAIDDYACLNSCSISEVVIPKTVTSIGKKAFGYCSGNHIHDFDKPIYATPRAMEFVEADDDEEFVFKAYCNDKSGEEYLNYIKTTYLSDCTNLEFMYNRVITGTAKKSQILPLIETEGLTVEFFYSRNSKLEDYLESAMNKSTDDNLIPITIYTTATGEPSAARIRKALKSRYFDEDTEFYYDWYQHIYVEATKAQINALKEDAYVTSVELGDSEYISSELYYAMFDADLEDTFDIYMSASGFENPETYLKLAHEAYFDNCEGEFVMVNETPHYVIYGASKQQIIDTSCVDYLFMQLFEEPQISKYNNLTIYGEAGSYTEEYAKANNLKFEQVKTDTEYVLGDVNLDGTVTIVDATLIMKANVGMEKLNEQQTKLADLDSNGVVNVSDATQVQKILAGL